MSMHRANICSKLNQKQDGSDPIQVYCLIGGSPYFVEVLFFDETQDYLQLRTDVSIGDEVKKVKLHVNFSNFTLIELA